MKPTGRLVLVLFVAANMLNYMDRYVLAAVLNPIGKSMSLTDTQLGLLASVFLGMYMISAPFFSAAADRHSRTKVVAIGILIWSLATAAASLAHDYTTLLVTRALVGVGEAAYATIGPPILADLVPEKSRAKVFTWFYLAIPVGSAIGFGMGGAIEGLAGWRASFLVAGLPGLVLAFLMSRTPDPVRGTHDTSVIDDTADQILPLKSRVVRLFKNRIFIACTLCYVGYTFTMGALAHWAPTFFQRQYGQSASTSGTIFGAIAVLSGICGTFLGGQLTDRLQHKFPNIGIWISMASLLVALPVVYLGTHETDPTIGYSLWCLAMTLLFINTSPINAATVSCLPASLRPTGMAANILAIHLLGDAISPAIVGARSAALGGDGMALGSAMSMTLPALALGACILFFALHRKTDPDVMHV